MADTNKPQSGGADRRDRTRLIIDSDDLLNQAIQLRASKESVRQRRKVTKSDAVKAILREALAAEIAELESYSDQGQPAKPGKRKPSPPQD